MALRKIEILRGAWGAALLVAPERVLAVVHHATVDARSVAVTRVLGARQLTQAVLSGSSPGPGVLAAGVWVDLVHAGSALGLAMLDRSRVRAALTDAVIAATFAAAGYRDLGAAREARARRGSAKA